MMIVGGRIESVEGKREKEGVHTGLDMNIGIDGVEEKGNLIEIKYTYEVKYKDGIGNVKIVGYLYAEEDDKRKKEVLDYWAKNKKLPVDYVENILNAINYTGSYNATLIAKVVNLGAPFVVSRIHVEKKND